ncbi:MAG: autotransporter domain-containing protein [Gammaproteobacteria bacterium]|nr:autotransporter domain-containing protein [Gammaproteobacteria bacterium]
MMKSDRVMSHLSPPVLPMSLVALVSLAISPPVTAASLFDPNSIEVIEAYQGEATLAKRQAALAGLDAVLTAAGQGGGGGSGAVIIDGSCCSFGFYPTAPVIDVYSLIEPSGDADLGVAGAPVHLNESMLRALADLTTDRDFSIGSAGAVIDSNGFTFTISGDLVADGPLVKQGSGVLALSGTNSWQQAPYLYEGTLFGDTRSLQTDIASWSMNTISFSTFPCSGSGCPLFTAPPTEAPASPPVVHLQQDFDGSYGGVISGSASLIKTGYGNLNVTGTNSYSGETRILEGTLALAGEGEIGQGSLHIADGALFNMADAGGARSVSGISGAGGISLGGNQLNFHLQDDAVFAGVIGGSGSIGVSDASQTGTQPALTLGGVSEFSGSVQIGQGAGLALADAGSLNSTVELSVGGVFDISRADGDRAAGTLGGDGMVLLGDHSLTVGNGDRDGYFQGLISGSGDFIKVGGGTQYLEGTADYTGATHIEGGLLVANTQSLGSSVVNDASLEIGYSFNQGGEAITAYSGDISGTGELIKSGNGVLWLRGDNSYSGGTQILGGALIGNSDSLQGVFDNSAHLGFYQVQAGTYSGSVHGNGQLIKYGPGSLTLTGTNTHTGGTLFSGELHIGDDSNLGDPAGGLVIADGSLVLAGDVSTSRPVSLVAGGGSLDTAGFDLTLSGALTGSGELNKLGAGTLTLAGESSFSGVTRVVDGRLSVEGSTGHDVWLTQQVGNDFIVSLVPNPGNSIQVLPGAELGGSGLISADVVNQGRIARGDGIGAIHIDGDIQFTADSSFLVKVNAAGEADRLLLSGEGSIATLSGGLVAVQAENGDYRRSTQYTILSAASGVEGSFDNVTSDLAFLDPELLYDAHNVFLQLVRNDIDYADVGISQRQRVVGDALTRMASSSGNNAEVAQVLDQFETLNVDQARQALQSIAGPGIGATSQVTRLQQRTLVQSASSRLALLDGKDGMAAQAAFAPERAWLTSSGYGQNIQPALYAAMQATAPQSDPQRGTVGAQGLWLQGFVGTGRIDSDATSSASDYDVRGILTGYDQIVQDNLTLGVLMGYTESELSQEMPQSKVSVDAWQVGGYGRYRSGQAHVDGVLSYSEDNFDSARTVNLGAISQQAEGEYDGNTINAYVEAGYTIPGRVNVQPYAALQWVRQKQEAYTETGAGVLNLAVPETTTESLRSTLGLRASIPLPGAPDRPNSLEMRAGWAHEFKQQGSLTARLSGDVSGSGFTVGSREVPRDSVLLGIGLVSAPKKNITLFADLNGEGNAKQYSASLLAGFRYDW